MRTEYCYIPNSIDWSDLDPSPGKTVRIRQLPDALRPVESLPPAAASFVDPMISDNLAASMQRKMDELGGCSASSIAALREAALAFPAKRCRHEARMQDVGERLAYAIDAQILKEIYFRQCLVPTESEIESMLDMIHNPKEPSPCKSVNSKPLPAQRTSLPSRELSPSSCDMKAETLPIMPVLQIGE